MGANPHANGGLLLKDLVMPAFQEYAVAVKEPGTSEAEATRVAGRFLRDVMKLNSHAQNFRVMGPDETTSNRLDAIFEVTDRAFVGEILPTDGVSRSRLACLVSSRMTIVSVPSFGTTAEH